MTIFCDTNLVDTQWAIPYHVLGFPLFPMQNMLSLRIALIFKNVHFIIDNIYKSIIWGSNEY